MPNRRFEMYQYRQIIVRLRLGETNRSIALFGSRRSKENQGHSSDRCSARLAG